MLGIVCSKTLAAFVAKTLVKLRQSYPVSWLFFAGLFALACAALLSLSGARSSLALNLLHVYAAKQLLRHPQSGASGLSASAAGLGDFRTAGILELSSGRTEDALRLLDEAVQRTPQDLGLHFFRGRAYYELGQMENALAEWRLAGAKPVALYFTLLAAKAAGDQFSTLTDNKFPVGENIEIATNDRNLIIDYSRIAISLDPTLGEAYYQLGRGLEAKKAWNEAINNYYHTLELTNDPFSKGKIYRAIGNILKMKGNPEIATYYYEQAIETLPNHLSYFTRLELVDLYLSRKNFQRAEYQTNKALEIYPNNDAAYVKKGYLYFYRGDYEKAKEWFLLAIKIDPHSGRGNAALGNLFVSLQEYDKAVIYLERATFLGWNTRWTWTDLGNAYYETDQFLNAERAYKKVVDLEGTSPGSLGAWLGLAQIYTEKGNLIQAKIAWEKVLEIEPENPLALTFFKENH